uniref:Chloride channel, voltage-sensitive 6 n=1 Tax=Mus musculus TaxID=10090 RepID=D6RHT0_MOUSE
MPSIFSLSFERSKHCRMSPCAGRDAHAVGVVSLACSYSLPFTLSGSLVIQLPRAKQAGKT